MISLHVEEIEAITPEVKKVINYTMKVLDIDGVTIHFDRMEVAETKTFLYVYSGKTIITVIHFNSHNIRLHFISEDKQAVFFKVRRLNN